MKDALYGCYLRVGDPGPWAGPWAGIARLEIPSGIGRDAAVEAAERAAGWLPVFASALHRDARAPGRTPPQGAALVESAPERAVAARRFRFRVAARPAAVARRPMGAAPSAPDESDGAVRPVVPVGSVGAPRRMQACGRRQAPIRERTGAAG